MMYSLGFTKNAAKILQKMERNVSQKIFRALQEIKTNPHSHIEPLIRPKGAEPLYKLRVGMYRVIIAMRNDVMVILVVDVGPRKTIYKKYGGKG